MRRKNLNVRGFTLIELTFVVTVIGILAAIAIPDFMKFQAKARQSEAKSLMPLIAAYEMDYKLRHGKFVACGMNPAKQGAKWDPKIAGWGELGFEPVGLKDYSFEVVLKDNNFMVRAVGNIDNDPELDVWEMTGIDQLINTFNDVSDTKSSEKK